jgi:ribosomal-protein-serine acetyltransferase
MRDVTAPPLAHQLPQGVVKRDHRRLMLPERMEEDGLVLRRWVVGDAEALHAVIAESASHLRPWLTWVREENLSVEGRRAFIAERERDWQGGGSVLLGIFVGERIAGGCSLNVRAGGGGVAGADGVLEIGYWLHPAFRGHGLATRAARLLTEAALAMPDLLAVEIRHDKSNAASGAVPRRLGYTLVGEAPNRAPAPADSGTDLVWRRAPVPRNLVLRLSVDLVPSDRGGRHRPIADGYRASMSFAQRRRGIEPVVHDAIVVLEQGSMLAPGEGGLVRAWVLMPAELPRSVGVGSVFTLLEGNRIIGRAKVLTMCSDPTLQPLEDLRAAKTRPLVESSAPPLSGGAVANG